MFGPRAKPPHVQLPHRRKRPTISCSECHRRKQKCDRQQPCFHCTRRGKTEMCLYEHMAEADVCYEPITTGLGTIEGLPTLDSPSDATPGSETVVDQVMLRRLGYSSSGSTGTLKIMSQHAESDGDSATPADRPPNNDTAIQYIGLIRILPSRKHADILVRSFFTNVAWQYDVIDEGMFRDELLNWDHVSYPALKQGPDNLPVNTRYFPALLLQVLALALLFQPAQYDNVLEDLKYAPDIDFPDLAADYSAAGHRLMCMLGSRNMPLSKVQAGLMKACFEKSIGSVIESWHTLGSTIRDAQELGLHLLGPCDANKSARDAIQPREVELRRKLWLVLHLWDAHMAVVLGRPMATKTGSHIINSTSPLAGSPSRNQHGMILSPFEIILCGYHAAYKYLEDIHDLDVTSKNAQEMVKKIHDAVVSNISRLPAWATSPSPRLDGKYPWLPFARETLITEVYFVLLALHRPFMSSLSTSRVEALKAALQMLESQNRLFTQAGPHVHMTFTLVFATFDAMVLIAATYLDFPNDNQDLLPASMNCMEWGLARLDAMRSRNTMAGMAYDVVQRLYQRLLKCISLTGAPASYIDGSGDLNKATQAPYGDHAEQEVPQARGAKVATQQDSDYLLRQQPLFDLASQDLIGNFWQLMDDLT